jgi:apolipoprotein N-acyltransferase
MRQHLANVIFRAVENGRPLFRITNSGLSASIRADGFIEDITTGFQPAVRTWKMSTALTSDTFYTKHGDLFVHLCAVISTVAFISSLFLKKRIRSSR